MLGPDDQRTLVQSLAPPTGFTVDVAVGTTYSLDLVAALTVPTAFLRAAEAMDPASPSGDDTPETPLALLTAVRSFADRITIFTDASRILVPEQRLGESFAFLDQMVVPVPAREHGSFHPKVWVIRYRRIGSVSGARPDRLHRVVVATRNLTFDRSLDAALVLEEGPDGAPHPRIGEMLTALASVDGATGPETPRGRRITALAESVAAARFEPPEGFESARFDFWGLSEHRPPRNLFAAEASATVVVSPFLTEQRLDRLTAASGAVTVISRADQLDAAVPLGDPRRADENWEAFIVDPDLQDAADLADLTSDGQDQPPGAGAVNYPDQLHAKIYVQDTPDGTSTVTIGSANATEAAFTRNVEAVVRLRGVTADVGTEVLLGDAQARREPRKHAADRMTFLLQRHRWSDEESPADPDQKVHEKLREARERIARSTVTATVTPEPDAEPPLYGITYRFDTAALTDPIQDGITMRISPLARRDYRAVPSGGVAVVDGLALTGVNRFLAVQLTACGDSGEITEEFTLACRLDGLAADHLDRVIAELLGGDGDRLIRFLLMHLHSEEAGALTALVREELTGARATGTGRVPAVTEAALLEPLLRAAVAGPERLRDLEQLLDVIAATGTAGAEDVRRLWSAVTEVFPAHVQET